MPHGKIRRPYQDQYIETPKSVGLWADATFGKVESNLSTAERAKKELNELILALEEHDKSIAAGVEIADVIIVLYRLANDLGVDVDAEINHKMAINRKREWILDGKGHGQHKKTERRTYETDSTDIDN